MTTTYLSYRLAAADMTASLDRVGAEPQVAREVAYWRDTIAKTKTLDDFVGDRRLFAFAMKAFGLSDMTYAKAFMTRLLKEGVSDPKAMANKLTDPRYLDFAKTFDFKTYGDLTTSLTPVRYDVVDRYLRQTLEEKTGEASDGARLALYFQRKAANLTSPMQILADSALLKVAQTALGLPATMSNLDIDKQADMIAARLDVKSLSDPARLDAFVKRFAALYDVENGDPLTTSPALMLAQASGSGFSVDTLMSIATMKKGG